MDGEEQRLVQLGVERMHKVAQLLEAEVCGDGVAVQLVLLGQLFGERNGHACSGLKHRNISLYIMYKMRFTVGC